MLLSAAICANHCFTFAPFGPIPSAEYQPWSSVRRRHELRRKLCESHLLIGAIIFASASAFYAVIAVAGNAKARNDAMLEEYQRLLAESRRVRARPEDPPAY